MKQITAIYNANLVLDTGVLWDGVLLLEDDTIVAFGKERGSVFCG